MNWKQTASSHVALVLFVLLMAMMSWTTTTRAQSNFNPVPMPDPGVQNYNFPESEIDILNWVSDQASPVNRAAVHNHAWGLWAALTDTTSEFFEGQQLRVFETWLTPCEIQDGVGAVRDAWPLSPPNQQQEEQQVVAFVKYNPAAADHAASPQNLMQQTTLEALIQFGETHVPVFPDSALTVKAVFLPDFIDGLEVIHSGGAFYRFPVWPGLPSEAKKYGPKEWPNNWVWIDLGNTGSTNSTQTTNNPDISGRTPETTYGLGDFIHFTDSGGTVRILAGMHVTTREIRRWTWQSFWWVNDPDNPDAPSSAEIRSNRPPQVTGAPKHYAACTAYQMIDPPFGSAGFVGNVPPSKPVICFNPYLEAVFTPDVLRVTNDLGITNPSEFHPPVPAPPPGTQNTTGRWGVHTTCMSCHAQARWPVGVNNDPNSYYTGAQYIDASTILPGQLRLDFAWSIQGTVPSPPTSVTTYPIKAALHQNVPNPFNPRTSIAFDLDRAGSVRLLIYDTAGRLVRTLVDEIMEAGRQTAEWNGLDDRGESLASGVYVYRLVFDGGSTTKRIVLLK